MAYKCPKKTLITSEFAFRGLSALLDSFTCIRLFERYCGHEKKDNFEKVFRYEAGRARNELIELLQP